MSLETMTKLATFSLTSNQVSVSFLDIPQYYTDLKLVVSARCTEASISRFLGMYINDFVYPLPLTSNRGIIGNGSTATSQSSTDYIYAGQLPGSSATANTFSNIEIYIPNYSAFNNKSISIDSVAENNATTTTSTLYSALVSNPTPVYRIFLDCSSAFVTNSTFTLYGIKNAAKTAGNSIKATGGNIIFDGTYVYHVFPSTDTFTPTQSLSADILVVAGGGGGGRTNGGGGGAGGLLYFTSQSLTATGYTCTVGAGGAGGTSFAGNASSGVDSQFGALTLVKGGGGGQGGNVSGTALTGGSGAGAGSANYSNTGGSPTSGQGYAGGTSNISTAAQRAAGGGGAGAIGGTPTGSSNGGAGGVGIQYLTLATATGTGANNGYYAGGGGGGTNSAATGTPLGGTGGLGGGADGKSQANLGVPTAALVNTGGGGGGSGGNGDTTNGGAGGSGIIIVRYKG
jgi:hypothetical protein